MDKELKDYADEKWAVAKALMERDGQLKPDVFLAAKDGLYEIDIREQQVSGLQAVMMSVFEQAQETKSYAVVLTGPTVLPENESEMDDIDIAEFLNSKAAMEFCPKGVIQIVYYSHGAIYLRTAAKKELPGGFIEYQDISDGFERG